MTLLETYSLLAAIGVGGGLIAGAVGLAGGIFIVPAIIAMFGIDAMGDAIVVSFFAVFFNSLSSTVQNRKARGSENFWELVGGAKLYTGGAIVAALLVAAVLGQHKSSIPKSALASMQLLLAVFMLVPRSWYVGAKLERGNVKDSVVGSVVGGMSALIGVGGGTYTIAYFMTHGREIRDCTLTANYVGMFIGAMSLMGYYGYSALASAGPLIGGASVIDPIGKTVLVIAGMLASPVGVHLQSKVPGPAIKTTIVVLLAVSSVYVLLQ